MVIILIYLFFILSDRILSPATPQNRNSSICFGEKCFFVEIAKTSAEREKGLMYRNLLAKDRGMLFIFDKEGIYPFWMKNTLIPLDIIWIDSNNKVVFIANNVQPCKNLICPITNPLVSAKYVLEINANIAKTIGIKTGDQMVINIK